MGVIGYTNLAELELTGNETPAKDFLRKILESANKATKLTQNLLAFSRRQPITLEPTLLNEIIKKMEPLLKNLLGENITLTFGLTESEITVLADSDKLEQVIMNLATNAVDAMPNGGSLSIITNVTEMHKMFTGENGIDQKGSYATFSISDTGAGMDKDTMKKIFAPFFTTKERGKGTGIGLSIAYGIIKQHHGHIEVTSEKDRGTTFIVYIPVTEKEVEKTFTASPSAVITDKVMTSKTILVAEDENSVREIVTKLLEGKGYTIIPSSDGEEAVAKFEENKEAIDMLLFDVMMPKKNGKEAYDVIKNMRPDIKVLFMSGYTEDIVTNKDIRREGLHFLQKPVIPDKLFQKVTEILSA